MTSKLIRRPDKKGMRRFRDPELKKEGCAHEEITEALGVTKAAVSKRMKAVRGDGEDALIARPRSSAGGWITYHLPL
jgi:transposase